MLNFIQNFYCWPADMTVVGYMESAGSTIPAVRLERCNESDMLPGISCMGDTELDAYFDGKKKIRFMYGRNFVDFEDIKNPVKQVIKGSLD